MIFKYALTAALVVAISELAKRSSPFSALVASLPLTSILAMYWLFHETQDLNKVSQLSYGIFWMVLPSLAFFLLLPLFIRLGLNFYAALLLSCLSMAAFYTVFSMILNHLQKIFQ